MRCAEYCRNIECSHVCQIRLAAEAQDLAGELLETDELKLETNEDILAILAVADMLLSEGLTAEDLIKRLITEPT